MFQLNFSATDTAAAPSNKDLGVLPEWDLSDLYKSPDAPALHSDLAWLEKECQSFAADYEGKLAALSAKALLSCVQRQEKISAVSGRIMSYAGLRYYQLTTDGERTKFMSDLQEKVQQMQEKISGMEPMLKERKLELDNTKVKMNSQILNSLINL